MSEEDQASYRVITQSMVSLNVTTAWNGFPLERRFNKSITVANLKDRLELLTGASPATMRLQLFSKTVSGAASSGKVSELDDNAKPLGFYPVEDGMTLHVIDEATSAKSAKSLTAAAAADDDLASEAKFQLSNEEYAKRNDTVRAYLLRNKLGKYAPADGSNGDSPASTRHGDVSSPNTDDEISSADNLPIGSRCQVTMLGQLTRRGEIKFVGTTHFKPGLWVGVAYDEPVGKNDGAIDGRRYFDCAPKYGAFVRPPCVQAGDFPEEEIDADEM